MDDAILKLDPANVAAASRLFPRAERALHAPVNPLSVDMRYLAEGARGFSDHCWDENGHL